ncbi:hypothetical protein [Saccharothrix sp. HUAS TT1]|uniref:hypothetical protein n=1 Tax=Saccharothrix sp. HUAS TT1 TaxID=3231910 RepID=UPI00345B7AD9
MSHIAFFNIPGHGHVNPTLPVVTELVNRGHRVTYAVPTGFADLVARAGARPVAHPTVLPADDREWPTEVAPAMRLFLDEARSVLPVLERAYADDRPDLVVYDIGAWTARLLADRWGVPAIQFPPPSSPTRGGRRRWRTCTTTPTWRRSSASWTGGSRRRARPPPAGPTSATRTGRW